MITDSSPEWADHWLCDWLCEDHLDNQLWSPVLVDLSNEEDDDARVLWRWWIANVICCTLMTYWGFKSLGINSCLNNQENLWANIWGIDFQEINPYVDQWEEAGAYPAHKVSINPPTFSRYLSTLPPSLNICQLFHQDICQLSHLDICQLSNLL